MANRDTTPINRTSGGDLTGHLWHFGKESPAGVVPCAVAGERADGIISGGFPRLPTKAGQGVDLDIDRLMKVEAGAAFPAGANLTTDATGRAVVAADGDHVNAVAIEAAPAAGVFVEVRAPFGRGPSSSSSSGPIVNAPLAPAPSVAGALDVIPIDIPDAATATYAFVAAEKIEIIDVILIKDGDGAGNTVQLKDATGAAISNAIAAAVDGTVTRAGSLPKGKRTLAAGTAFQITASKVAGSTACQLFLHVIKRA